MSQPQPPSRSKGRDRTAKRAVGPEEAPISSTTSHGHDDRSGSVLTVAYQSLLNTQEASARDQLPSAASPSDSTALTNTKWFLVSKNDNYDWIAEVAECNVDEIFVDPSNPPVKGLNLHYLRWQLRRVIQHLAFRLITIVLILLDMGILIAETIMDCPTTLVSRALDICVLVMSSYFMLEILARIFAITPRVFFSRKWWFNTVDFVVVIVSFAVSLASTLVIIKFVQENEVNETLCDSENESLKNSSLLEWGRILVFLRILRAVRLVRLARIYTEHHQVKKAMRQLVSQNKRRYQEDGVDLDLTYVTSKIIAMSFPSSGCMAWYRNPISDVAMFLDKKHCDSYRVYNLCSERTYDETFFQGRVSYWPIDDHNVPSVNEMVDFVQEVKWWLSLSDSNVIAVHCKGGKGRTGTMICILLIHYGLFNNADDSLDYFGNRRTDTNVSRRFQGVETASQIRYVSYYERLLRSGQLYPNDVSVALQQIRIHGLRHIGRGDGSDLSLELHQGRSDAPLYVTDPQTDCNAWSYSRHDDVLTIHLTKCPHVFRDVRVKFYCSSGSVPTGYEHCAFYFWFHTFFLNVDPNGLDAWLTLTREEIDNTHKQRLWNLYKDSFRIHLSAKVISSN